MKPSKHPRSTVLQACTPGPIQGGKPDKEEPEANVTTPRGLADVFGVEQITHQVEGAAPLPIADVSNVTNRATLPQCATPPKDNANNQAHKRSTKSKK